MQDWLRQASSLSELTVDIVTSQDTRPRCIPADQGLVVEWLVPAAEPEAGAALRAVLAEHARAVGVERLCAMVPEWTEAWMRFQHEGFHAEPTRYVLCARHRQRRHDAFWLFKRWYTTLADGSLA